MPKARSNVSKPSVTYAANFSRVFGRRRRRPSGRGRSFSVFDPKRKKWVPIESLPVRPRGVALWPRYSDTMSVHPDNIPKVNALLRSKGVQPPEWDKLGRPKLESKRYEKRFAEARGYFNNDAGYGDALPKRFQGRPPDLT